MNDNLSRAAEAPFRLLAPTDPAPVEIHRADGRSRILFTCDHAGRAMPARLGKLGLPDSELERHIAYDIGIASVTRSTADALDAMAIMQPYSRLVIDCNRRLGNASSIPVISENTTVPGNENLVADESAARIAEIFSPYHAAITAELNRRKAAGEVTVLISMHSFTPVYKGVARPWHVGTLYNRHAWLAEIVFALLSEDKSLTVGDNEPYMVSDDTDYTIPVHGEQRSLPHVGIEIRQDLIASEVGQREWAARMARIFKEAVKRLG